MAQAWEDRLRSMDPSQSERVGDASPNSGNHSTPVNPYDAPEPASGMPQVEGEVPESNAHGQTLRDAGQPPAAGAAVEVSAPMGVRPAYIGRELVGEAADTNTLRGAGQVSVRQEPVGAGALERAG